MSSRISIALDCMGGDFGPSAVVPAALLALKKHSDLDLILVGNDEAIYAELGKKGSKDHPAITVQHASQVVTSNELPSHALRGKKDSSMRVAINMVKEGKANACA